METDTFPREDVQKFLSGMVCVKVNPGKGKDQKKIYDSFGVTGVPTLLLLDPTGKEIARSGGKPPPAQFVGAFVNPFWNKLVESEKAVDAKGMAENVFMLTTWFPGTEAFTRAEEMAKRNDSNAAFKTALDDLRNAHQRSTLLARGNWELRNGKKKEATATYQELLAAQPDCKEAEEARKTLKKLGVKLDEPAKK